MSVSSAIVQARPIYLDLAASLGKATGLIESVLFVQSPLAPFLTVK